MTKDELLALLEKKISAKQEFDRWQMANVAGRSTAELLEIDLGHARTRKAWLQAESAYENALREFG